MWRKKIKLWLNEGFGKRLLWALSALLVPILLTILLVRLSALDEVAASFHDLQMRLSEPRKNSEVAIVMINDEDYENTFKKNGSLNPAMLQALITAVAEGNPRVIGVDIDTSDGRYRDFQITEWRRPVVWLRAVYNFDTNSKQNPLPEKPVPSDVLGGKDPKLNTGQSSGLPTLIDINDVTRFYQRDTETTDGTLPSFPWAVVHRFRSENGQETEATTDTDLRIIRFAGDNQGSHRGEHPASRILDFAKESWWSNNDIVEGKIVLIGGNYLGQDRHDTPLGEMYGVRILATVVETELDGGGIKRPNDFALIPLWIFQGLVLILIFQLFPLSKATWQNLALSLALTLTTALICSFIAARSIAPRSLAYLAYFIPVGFGVFIIQVIDQLNDWRKEKLEDLYHILRGLYRIEDVYPKLREFYRILAKRRTRR